MLLFRPTLPVLTATSFLTTTFLLTSSLSPLRPRPLLLDSTSTPVGRSDSLFVQHGSNSQSPVLQRRDGQNVLNARNVRQITTGSIAGLLTGLTVALFSKPLAVLLGLLVAGVQYGESRGWHIIPYSQLQRWFGGIDVRRAVRQDAALKLSFGVTFALAGFASF
ncbi:MAG: hypothetical protein M1822_010258 [Bathelium mastoideum]|nr:MAG: hypothetical protein M1822_010258 [Bathelium mastoideum]